MSQVRQVAIDKLCRAARDGYPLRGIIHFLEALQTSKDGQEQLLLIDPVAIFGHLDITDIQALSNELSSEERHMIRQSVNVSQFQTIVDKLNNRWSKIDLFFKALCEDSVEDIILEFPEMKEDDVEFLKSRHYDVSHYKELIKNKSSRDPEERAFSTQYKDDGILTYISSILQGYINDYVCSGMDVDTKGAIKVPLTSLIMSSGYGKSRALHELSKQGGRDGLVKMVYGCVSSKQSAGYPKYTAPLVRLLEKLDFQNCLRFFVMACILSYKPWVESWSTEPDDYWNIVIKRYETPDIYEAWKEYEQNASEEDVIVIVLDEISQIQEHNLNRISPTATEFIRALSQALIGFDPKKNFGRSGAKIKTSAFFVLVDSHAQIAGFTPPLCFDGADRLRGMAYQYYEPIYHINSFDLFATDLSELNKVGIDDSYYVCCSFHLRTTDLELLPAKLVNVPIHYIWNSLLDASPNGLISVMAVKFGLAPWDRIAISSSLLATNMATAFCMDLQRNNLRVAFPSEPILAEAASLLLSRSRERNTIEQDFKAFIYEWQHGAFDIGKLGEFVARIILTYSLEVVKSNIDDLDYFSKAIPFPDFWDEFVGKTYRESFSQNWGSEDYFKLPEAFMNAEIALTHWIFCAVTPVKATLENAYWRRAGLVMPDDSEGFHLIIPVQLADGTFGFVAIHVQDEEEIDLKSVLDEDLVPRNAFCLVDDSETSNSDLDPRYETLVALEHISLFMGPRFDGHWTDSLVQDIKSARIQHSNHYVILGISSASFSPELVKTFDDMLNRRSRNFWNGTGCFPILQYMYPDESSETRVDGCKNLAHIEKDLDLADSNMSSVSTAPSDSGLQASTISQPPVKKARNSSS